MSYGAVPQRSPYGNNDPAFTESATGFINPQGQAVAKKKGLSPWIKFGIPVALVVIVAAVVGGVLGSRKSSSSSSSSSGSNSGKASGDEVASNAPVATATNVLAAGRFATATDSKYMVPIYPSAVGARKLFHVEFGS
jgi:preprotein translocase subunit SecG